MSAFVNEDVLDPELLQSPPSRESTSTEIAEILEPWRPQRLRHIAAAFIEGHHKHDYYILRTYYGGGAVDDAKLRGWLDTLFEEREEVAIWPENEWLYVLDDPTLFDFADDYTEVYTILPELAGQEADRRFTDEDVEEAREAAEAKKEHAPHIPEEEHWEDAITYAAAVKRKPWMFILDEDAFKDEELGLSLRDKKGIPVKEWTIRPDFDSLDGLHMDDFRGKLWQQGWWEIPTARKYRTRGRIMRGLMERVRGK